MEPVVAAIDAWDLVLSARQALNMCASRHGLPCEGHLSAYELALAHYLETLKQAELVNGTEHHGA